MIPDLRITSVFENVILPHIIADRSSARRQHQKYSIILTYWAPLCRSSSNVGKGIVEGSHT